MKTPQDVRAIVQALKELYPDGICSLQYQKDYELLFATRLSAQCTDERVNQVTPALFAQFPTLEALAAAEPEVLGPAPAPVLKVNNRFRYRLFWIGRNDHAARDRISGCIRAFAQWKGSRGLALFADCNGLD